MVLRLTFIAVFCLISGQVLAAAGKHDLIFVTEEWPPSHYSQDGEATGFSTDIIRAMMANLGEEHDIRIYPGTRATGMLDNMPNIMAFTYFRTPQRETKYKWIGPLDRDAIYFYKRKGDSRRFVDMKDIRSVNSIMIAYGGMVRSRLEAQGLKNYVAALKNRDQIRSVLRGKVDLLANFTRLGLAYYLRNMGEASDALVPTEVSVVDVSLDIACSKDIPDAVIARWQAALDHLHKSGEYARIYHKYLR